MPANDKIRKRSDWMRTEDIKPIKVGRTEDAETCDAIEVHSDLLKIVKRQNYMIWLNCLRCLGIRPE